MKIKVTYVDSHFDDGLTNIAWNMDYSDEEAAIHAANAKWYALHFNCQCVRVNTYRS